MLLSVFSRYLNVPEKFIELPGIQGVYLSKLLWRENLLDLLDLSLHKLQLASHTKYRMTEARRRF